MNVPGKYWVLGMYCLISLPLFSQSRYLELNLNNQAIQSRVRAARPRPILEVFRVIEKAAGDRRIRGMVLNISAFSANREFVWELRSALENFKSKGKKICAFISGADLDLYCLASVADRIVMDEQGALSLTGYAWGRGYVQHSLEKLGIGVRELRYLDFKSAAETYTRDSMSGADRKQYGEWLDDVFMVTRDTLMKARSWTEDQFNTILDREFLYSSKSALERGLVDRRGRGEAVRETLRELEGGEVKNFALYGDRSSSLMESSALYSPRLKGGLFSRPPVIAVVYATGQTDMERGMAARSLSRTIREVSERKRVRAMVVRINSPGGSAEAADYIAEAIKHAKERIPVVVSMGQVAASGGYWAAMYASHITASPYTLTGSIGVIGSWFFDRGLNDRLGFTVDSLQRGAHADLMTGMILPRRDFSPEEEERYRAHILDLYAGFVAGVAAGRGMEIEKVEAVAQGRVYSGLGALDAGLVDSIGGLADAIRTARSLADIPEGRRVAYSEYPRPRFIDKALAFLSPVGISDSAARDAASGYGAATTAGYGPAAFLAGLFLPEPLLADLRYRLSRNGQVMPILPLESGWMTR